MHIIIIATDWKKQFCKAIQLVECIYGGTEGMVEVVVACGSSMACTLHVVAVEDGNKTICMSGNMGTDFGRGLCFWGGIDKDL